MIPQPPEYYGARYRITRSLALSNCSVYTIEVIRFGSAVSDIAPKLDRDGIICFEDFVSPEWLREAQDSVKSHIAVNGWGNFSVSHADSGVNTPAYRLTSDPTVRSILKGVTVAGCPHGVPQDDTIFAIMRIFAGQTSANSSSTFHYDTSVVTMAIPLLIPDTGAGAAGALVIFPNMRPFRRFAISNLVDRVVTHNTFYRRYARAKLHQAPDRHIVQYKPGNMYLFSGYRAYHGTTPCVPNSIRAVLLLHYGDPHAHQPVMRLARSLRGLIRAVAVPRQVGRLTEYRGP